MTLAQNRLPDSQDELSPPADLSPEQPTSRSSRRRLLVWIPLFGILLALFGLLAWGLMRQQAGTVGVITNDGPSTVAILSRPAPDFTLPLYDDFNGQAEFSLSDYRGQVVVVNFWASWCPPCRVEAPALEQAWRAAQDEDVVIIGINIWDSEQAARAYLQEFAITFPNVIDERGRLTVEYGMTGVPETYFLTPEGMINHKIMGAVSQADLLQGIADARQASTETTSQ